jgi:type 1 glutamine amidotransferase
MSFRPLSLVILLALACSSLAQPAPSAPSGEKFGEVKPGTLRVLLAGGGSSHDFEKWFHQADSAILKSAGYAVAYTANADEALALLPQADALVLSTNQKDFGTADFQEALRKFVADGKGVVVLHAGAWYNWPKATGYNDKFLGGGSRGHDALGKFTVTVQKPEHPVVKGVPATLEVEDELYLMLPEGDLKWEVLATTSTSKKTGQEHASIWVVPQAGKGRVVGIALGHDGRVHDLDAFKTLLVNAVRWAAGK